MRCPKLKLLIIIFLLIMTTTELKTEKSFDYYLSQFHEKQTKAKEILREIESDLKNGLRKNVCSRQKEAATLGLEAIDMLIKAYEISEESPPLETIKSNKIIWENILNECLWYQ